MFDVPALSSHPVDVGIRSEGAILGELSKRGYDVLAPFSYNHRYDYVIDLGDRFAKVQCKTGRLKTGAVVFSKSARAPVARPFIAARTPTRFTSFLSIAPRSMPSMPFRWVTRLPVSRCCA